MLSQPKQQEEQNQSSRFNKFYHGDALNVLKTLESESIDCCITSPPYWALRDYKTEGQLGLETTFQEYISKLVEIFDQVKRVLKRSGTCWVVLGDTYNGNTKGNHNGQGKSTICIERGGHYRATSDTISKSKHVDIPDKSLCMIPSRFAIAMIDNGWVLRNDIIWHKPNCMPSSAKDRFTIDYEHVFFFVKSKKYGFETQYEPDRGNPKADEIRINSQRKQKYNTKYDFRGFDKAVKKEWHYNGLGRIKRAVWKIPTQPFKEAHFAVFPQKLVEPMLKAGCPLDICNNCNKPREQVMEFTGNRVKCGHGTSWKAHGANITNDKTSVFKTGTVKERIDKGLSDCGCNAGFHPGVVLDPFSGSGTVAVVAKKLQRNWIGIELNQSYIEMAQKRIDGML